MSSKCCSFSTIYMVNFFEINIILKIAILFKSISFIWIIYFLKVAIFFKTILLKYGLTSHAISRKQWKGVMRKLKQRERECVWRPYLHIWSWAAKMDLPSQQTLVNDKSTRHYGLCGPTIWPCRYTSIDWIFFPFFIRIFIFLICL